MKKFLQFLLCCTITMCFRFQSTAQSFAVNTDGSSAHSSALLDVKSTAKGVLVPRMNKLQKNSIANPATGLLIFQDAPDSTGFYYYNGTAWAWLATASNSNGWLTTGNTGTDSALNFLGTLDDKPLMLRQNNLWMGQLNTRNHTFFIGGGSGQNNSGVQNTGFGDSSLFNNTTGIGNTAFGYRSMAGNGTLTGGLNTAFGNNTL